MSKQDYDNRIVLIMAVGIVSIAGALVIGEMYMSHNRGSDISSEIVSLIKMIMTGMLGVVSYYLGGRNTERVMRSKKDEEVEDDAS